jgi:cytochrome c-type biogenesis protein
MRRAAGGKQASAEVRDLTPFDNVAARIQEVSEKRPDEILVAINNRVPQLHDIHRVNIRTGERTIVQQNDGYVGFMTGAGAAERVSMRRALPGTAAFVGGLTVVFVGLGASASALGSLFHAHRATLELVSGILIIVFGAVMVLGGRIPLFLARERRIHLKPGGHKPGGGALKTFLIGAAFAFAWTPCIGPTLGAALNLAATADGMSRGVVLLFSYSMGIGLPFVLAGLGLLSFGGRLKRNAATIQLVGGLILVGVGVLIVLPHTGLTDVGLTWITIWMLRGMTNLGIDFWNF